MIHRWLYVTLLSTAVGIELCVSANLLTFLGIPYVTNGGFLLLKFHPGTDVLVIMSLASVAAWPGRFFYKIDGALKVFLLALFGCIMWAAVFTGEDNLIVLLDTFLPAGLMAALLCQMSASHVRLLRRTMQWTFGINAMLALFEIAMQVTLIPLYIDDAAYHPHTEDFRPTALYDHPLTGALMTMMGLALAPSAGKIRALYQSLMWTSLIAFGGRMAIGISLLTLVQKHGAEAARLMIARDRRAGSHLLLSICGVMLTVIGSTAALLLGLGDRLTGHLYWDASAQVRLAQWGILKRLNLWQILLGTPRHEMLDHLNSLRLSSGVGVIENFWLLMLVSLGALGFAIFLVGLGALCVWSWQRSDRNGKVLLASILLVASSSNSLGRKSTVLVCLVATIVCMGRRTDADITEALVGGAAWRVARA